MSNFRDDFVDRMKKARKEAGLTQKDLAEKSNIPHSTLAAYENSNRTTMPDAESLTKIAKALGKSVDWLCNGDKSDNTGTAICETTSAQWVRRLIDMIDAPPTYPATKNKKTAVYANAIKFIAGIDREHLEYLIRGNATNGVGELPVAAMYFYGDQMLAFFKEINSVEALKTKLPTETYSDVLAILIKKAAHHFDPDLDHKENDPLAPIEDEYLPFEN